MQAEMDAPQADGAHAGNAAATGALARLKSLYAQLPLVYACSGCSSAAQLANALALRLDHERRAEMSCIAGVGGDVKPLLKLARSPRPVIALDGCPLHCTRHCLARHGVQPAVHLDLSLAGVRKCYHALASAAEHEMAWRELVLPAVARLSRAGTPAGAAKAAAPHA